VAKLRVGIIGAGSWATSNHLPVLARREEVELVVACRKGAEQLAQLQQTFGFAHVTEDYREALGLGLDAVVVASPPGLHLEHARAALQSGAHVLCEKPFTIEPTDAWQLERLARDRGRALLVSFGWHYRPIVVEARKMMREQGGVGEIEHVMVSMASGTRELLKATGAYIGSADSFSPESATWTEPSLSGGGYAPAQLSHAMGVALWLTDLRAGQVFALMNHAGARVDLHDAVAIRYTSGATGSVSGASCPAAANAIRAPDEPWPRHQLQVRVYGSEGHLIVDLERDFLWHYREDGVDNKAELPPHAGLYLCDGPPNTLVDLALGKSVENRSPAELGARTVEVVAAAEESARTGTSVNVSG